MIKLILWYNKSLWLQIVVQMLNPKMTHGDSKCGAQESQECVEMLEIVFLWLMIHSMMDLERQTEALKSKHQKFPCWSLWLMILVINYNKH